MRQKKKIFRTRLRNKHSIERVVMARWKHRHFLGMFETNREFHYSRITAESYHLLGSDRHVLRFDAMLDCDLPNGRRAHIEHIVMILQY